ncbi:MAG: hypothetical protein PUD85_05025, partial [Bacteroidales bacterium]|nr:hypothetical protein [Bacteroidales bacterium]
MVLIIQRYLILNKELTENLNFSDLAETQLFVPLKGCKSRIFSKKSSKKVCRLKISYYLCNPQTKRGARRSLKRLKESTSKYRETRIESVNSLG